MQNQEQQVGHIPVTQPKLPPASSSKVSKIVISSLDKRSLYVVSRFNNEDGKSYVLLRRRRKNDV